MTALTQAVISYSGETKNLNGGDLLPFYKPNKAQNKPHNVDIQLDMKVSLDFETTHGSAKGSVVSLNSSVEEILDDTGLLIHAPLRHGYHYPLPKDNELNMRFFSGSKMFSMPVMFQERITRDGLVYAKLRRLGPATEGQRRHCYRLPCSVPVTVERYTAENKPESFEGMAVDFSDGGTLLAANDVMEQGERLTLSFELDKAETVQAVALRTERIEDGAYKYKTAIQFKFKDGDKAQKNRFYKYIVLKQMEERRQSLEMMTP